jgi:hypothetical protein
MSSYESHEQYMTRRIREEDEKIGVTTEFNNLRLTRELMDIREDIKQLQIDIAYMMQKYDAPLIKRSLQSSPEEIKIATYLNK